MAVWPEKFIARMRRLLGAEYPEFARQGQLPPQRGLRVNRLRCSSARFRELAAEGMPEVTLSPVPFSPDGFAVSGAVSGRHPWHHAGLFYLQEPSAMAAVTAADIRPGMRVLDLCAAPGGKSTAAASALMGQGLLLSNEVVPGRAAVLLSNLERMGVRNAVVTCEPPETLCAALAGGFDVVLVDAPCSGEGLFRREPAAVREWTPQLPAACARRQAAILRSARQAVRPGGVLVYSTCTFAPEENEGVVDGFLRENSDFHMEAVPAGFGRPAVPEWADAAAEVALARRIFPQDGGEGHFVARLRREGDAPCRVREAEIPLSPAGGAWDDFCRANFPEGPGGRVGREGDAVWLLPAAPLPDMRGLHVRRAGVPAGLVKHGGRGGERFEPGHALFMAAGIRPACVCGLPLASPELAAWLHGEEIAAPDGLPSGYVSVQAAGFPVGFGKNSGGRIKNHYPRGLRNL